MIGKSKSLGGLPYNCFSKLYESMVVSIVRYGAAIWGCKEYSCINAVHNRMCRYYLGVSKFTPNAAVQGDMGLRVPWQYQMLEVCRQWARFVNMSNDRVNKKVFKWCNTQSVKNWNSRVKSFLREMDKVEYCNTESSICKETFINEMYECVEKCNKEKWLSVINKENGKNNKGKNKLRTYSTFEQEFCSEPYVYNIMPKSHRSAYNCKVQMRHSSDQARNREV